MNLENLLNSAMFAWALAGLLLLMLALLAFLRRRQLIRERLGILILVGVLLLAVLALTLGPQ